MWVFNRHILSFILLSVVALSMGAFAAVDCQDYDNIPDNQKGLCKYYRVQSTGARPILYTVDKGKPLKKENAKKNDPFYVYAPDLSASPDTIYAYLDADGSEITETFTPVVSSADEGIVKLGLKDSYEHYNFRLGTATDLSADPKISLIYNFYTPTLRYWVDGKKVKDGWKLPDDIKVLDTISVEVELVVPVGPQKDSVDKFDKTFYIDVDEDCENLVFLDTNGIAKTKLADGTFRVDFKDGYARFLVTATGAIKKDDGAPFTMNSFKDSTTKEFLLIDQFPGDLRFTNPDMPSLDNAAIYDTDGDGIGDSIATWYSGATDSMKVKDFFYSWPSDKSYEEYSGDVKQKKDVYGYPDVEVKLQGKDANGAVKAYVCFIGGCDTLTTALTDSIGAAIQSATLVRGDGKTDTLVVKFNKDMDQTWKSGRGLKLNGDPIDVTAISKDGTEWRFTVKSGTVAVGDMLKIETDTDVSPKILTAADGVPTRKNNQEVPVQDAGRVYVDNEKNGFYDRDGDGRMDSVSVGFKMPITQKSLKDMDIAFYWLNEEGELMKIEPDPSKFTISDDGLVLGYAIDNPEKLGIMNMLTCIDSTYSKDEKTNYGYAMISNMELKDGKKVTTEPLEYKMHDYMPPVISSTFLNPESFQQMEPDKFRVTFSEAIDYKNVNLGDDCLAFYVDGKWVHYSLSSAEWDEDGRGVTLFMEAGEDLAERMNPADSVRFDNFTSGLRDREGNKVSENSPAVMVEGDPRVIMKTNSFADLNKAEELSDRVKPFTIEHVKNAKAASDQSSLGVLMDIGFSTIMDKDTVGASVPNMEEIGLHWELYVYTNLGGYVGGASGSISCDDPFFDGNCLENPDKLYVRWNMRADNGRKVGVGIYLAKFKIKVYGAKEDFTVERIFRWGISAKKR